MRYLFMPTDVYARMEQEWNAIRQGGEARLPLLHSSEAAATALQVGRGTNEGSSGAAGSAGTRP